ncbi:phosphoribosylaminoimidazole carboxylase [Microthyrium microscopicum]|uniref:Phosphoribosylaminoimidazole carboxylase n=1 Tax=Microthyrium microscopicum TaxID=703497 RepID=A0A6A6UC20_9PEZI|nr:phosphoribosylaminoimidazole carboxylase [Microthyrium microscopicum]
MDRKVGVLGGGQLGRMLAEAANRLNIKIIALDKEGAPTKQITAHPDHVTGSFKDPAAIRKLAELSDVLTIEIEHVDVEILQEIEKTTPVHPSPKSIKIIQDKYHQKEVLISHKVPVAESIALDSEKDLPRVAGEFGYPFMLKARTDAYDGRGNYVVRQLSDFAKAFAALGERKLYAERWAPFTMELAVMVIRTSNGTLAFPTVETVHENSICKLVYAPARGVSSAISQQAQDLAKKAVDCFDGKGIYAVEMFLLPDNTLLVNEIAPRPHNSGHYTIEGCYMSQYEAHLHAILDLPIPERRLRLREPSIMLNILGGKTADAHLELANQALARDGTVHLYGKGDGSLGRKMGHITVTAPTMAEAEAQVQPLIQIFDKVVSGTAISDSSDAKSSLSPLVAVLMGSDSDLPTMNAGIQILQKFNIPHTVRVTSAHRTPEFMAKFAAEAVNKGIKVIIAGAGGAAHLPGMVASHTTLPVIGVPVKGSVLDGVDSLYSIVQMPRGVPVATVGIGNSTNAALLAARIIGVGDDRIQRQVEEFAQGNADESLAKDAKLQEMGSDAYLEGMAKKK